MTTQNEELTFYHYFENTLSLEAMKPSKLNHIIKLHSNEDDRDVSYFKDSFDKHANTKTFADMNSAASHKNDVGLRASATLPSLLPWQAMHI